MVSSCGTRDGAHRYPCHALDPAKENIRALESLNGYIVWGCWELKRKFRLNRFKLWEQRLTLINGAEIPYRKVVVPCCKTCNNKYIGRIDRKIAAAVKGGFDEFVKLDEVLVFQWLSRILYSILYLEVITPRDPRFKRRKILKKTFFKSLETVYIFLNSVRIKAEFHKPYPWSIFIFKVQTHSDAQFNFDFKDNPIMLTIAVRMGDIGIVA